MAHATNLDQFLFVRSSYGVGRLVTFLHFFETFGQLLSVVRERSGCFKDGIFESHRKHQLGCRCSALVAKS